MSAEKTGRRRLRTGRGVLWIVSAMLVGSAVLRAAAGYSSVRAPEAGHGGEVETAKLETPVTAGGSCAPDPELSVLLAEISERGSVLDARETALAERAATLDLAEQEIRRNLRALEAAESALTDTMSRAETAAEDDLSRLTAVYENMKPKEAAALFGQMAPEFAAGFLGRMRADAAAAVMAGLDPRTAYAISVILAGRNADAPTE